MTRTLVPANWDGDATARTGPACPFCHQAMRFEIEAPRFGLRTTNLLFYRCDQCERVVTVHRVDPPYPHGM